MALRATVNRSVALLSRNQRRKIYLSTFFQASLSILDMTGIALMGITTSVLINDKFPKILSFVSQDFAGDQSPRDSDLVFLFTIIITLFTVKSIASLVFMNKISKYLTNISVELSSNYSKKYYKLPLKEITQEKPEQVAFSLGSAVTIAVLEVLGSLITMVSEFCLLMLTGLFLFVVNPFGALLSSIFFLAIFLLMNSFLRGKQSNLSLKRSRANIEATTETILIRNSLREIKLYEILDKFVSRFSRNRLEEASSSQGIFILSLIPKYLYEACFYIGIGFTFCLLLLTRNPEVAASQFALFLAAGSRLMPSLVRIQGCIATIRTSEGPCDGFFRIVAQVENNDLRQDQFAFTANKRLGAKAQIVIRDLEFAYSGHESWRLRVPSLRVSARDKIVVSGESGSGKSTFVDVLLGFIQDFSGILDYAEDLIDSHGKIDRNAIGFVPQRVNLFQGTVVENITFFGSHSNGNVVDVLNRVGLTTWLNSLPDGVNSQIDNLGGNISGGQAQRIGIARALYKAPKILILDEPTSALDSDTELYFIDELLAATQDVTVIAISHSQILREKFEFKYEIKEGTLFSSSDTE